MLHVRRAVQCQVFTLLDTSLIASHMNVLASAKPLMHDARSNSPSTERTP
jgi:hypothetical protein